ncbi:hypothetical protein [Fulvivirga lutimaris]|uniref:hypothetical protein n=1 Tax=Fulvivirga lutimaris TaxID=1819566 RepID=UPI0012BB8C36|nr:hypothetical protein [Fulvivirga lutimaris]MTI37908.1 hypothetical protein [Fulvivirga lutimaris]
MTILKYISLSVVLISLLTIVSCKDDTEPAPSEIEEQLTALMNGNSKWTLGNDGVTKDGFDVTSQFAGFKLTIGNKTYATENGLSPVWEVSGNWDFENENRNQIIRDGDTSINVSLTNGNLVLTFTAGAVPTGGRTESVSGEYQFNLVSE